MSEISDLTEKEMEDGSISCTALSLLYVCSRLEYDEKYFHFAKTQLNGIMYFCYEVEYIHGVVFGMKKHLN